MKMLVANWKANGDLKLIEDIAGIFKGKNVQNIIFCPPSCFFSLLKKHIPHAILGAQNVSDKENGAFTGEVTAKMLNDIDISYAIVGHSERRIHFKEKNTTLKTKLLLCKKYNIAAIFCVGENLAEKSANLTFKVIKKQLEVAKPFVKNIIIAYEPVWAIGSGLTPKIEEIQNTCQFIKGLGYKNVLYGGSVNSENYNNIITINSLDGVLMGGVSININELNKIFKA